MTLIHWLGCSHVSYLMFESEYWIGKNNLKMDPIIFTILSLMLRRKTNIKCLILKKILLDSLPLRNLGYIACIIGDVQILHYASASAATTTSWDESFINYAAAYGHLDCLMFLHKNGCKWDCNTIVSAAQNNQLACLKYMHENGCAWHVDVCNYAAECGNIDILRYAHENECPWNEDVCDATTRGDHVDCLAYALENGCPSDKNLCQLAAKRGAIQCLKYLYEQHLDNFIFDPTEIIDSALAEHLICLNACVYKYKHIECIQFAYPKIMDRTQSNNYYKMLYGRGIHVDLFPCF